ncbi:MAG: hypothetical protein J1E38_09645 [Paramuribaculum sp.]|nr:hypothetical protein [Paramuribaculum sp.]
MANSFVDSASEFLKKWTDSLISVAKLAVGSHRQRISPKLRSGKKLIVLGNGSSLRETIRDYEPILQTHTLLAVNFAAITEEFTRLRPAYYVMVDPVFFDTDSKNMNVERLHERLNCVDWEMTLFVPFKELKKSYWLTNENVTVVGFNFLGIEGFKGLCNWAFKSGRGMPRPRNVLIPSLMIGLWLGYKEIYITGADHSWTKTLEVDETNTVVSVQPHFYEESAEEKRRVESVYKNVKLYEILDSFRVAFKSYFEIKRFAARESANIYNSTPGSFIDAFPRRPLSSIMD